MRLIVIALLSLALARVEAGQAAAVEYEFTGQVTASTGSYAGAVAVNSRISGTFTLDYANAMASQSTGSVGSSFFGLASVGGQCGGCKPGFIPGRVFSMTAQADGQVLEAVQQDYYTYSYVLYASLPLGDGFDTRDLEETATGGEVVDGLNLYSRAGVTLVDGQGLPIPGRVLGVGYFQSGGYPGSEVDWSVTSIAPVPEPATAWEFMTGLLPLAWAGLRRRARCRPASAA